MLVVKYGQVYTATYKRRPRQVVALRNDTPPQPPPSSKAFDIGFPLIDPRAFAPKSGSVFERKSRARMLHGYGNAVVAPQALEFVRSLAPLFNRRIAILDSMVGWAEEDMVTALEAELCERDAQDADFDDHDDADALAWIEHLESSEANAL